ncbi:protein FAM193A-like [Anneissia japonica]|uniref:protein FAM193A-like n=1 Tax=Anneissia japonica TaxID=1529436 RepID=UPI00142566A2|nr:protein FAM193A-like [Anneissia japonica]
MSSSEIKRSKRRRNRRGGGKPTTVPRTQTNASGGEVAISNSEVMEGPHHNVPTTVSQIDVNSIPQPLAPRPPNPYLDREHCLLCHRERPDPPAHKVPPKEEGKTDGCTLQNVTQLPLWVCPDCRRTVEEEEKNTKLYESSLLAQDFLLQSNMPLISSLQEFDTSLVSSMPGNDGDRSSVTMCSCDQCQERHQIAADQEREVQQLQEDWIELCHVVRCIYWEAGTALAEDDNSSKLSMPRMKEAVHRFCSIDPHNLYLRLEREVEDFVREMHQRLLKQLSGGCKTPALAKQFVSMLLEEYGALCSAAKTLSSFLEELEKEHLQLFNLTWMLHNKHLFHSTIYTDQMLHSNLAMLTKQLRNGATHKETYPGESYSTVLHKFLKFDDEMSVVGAVWRDCEQLIQKFTEKQSQQGYCRQILEQDLDVFKRKACDEIGHNQQVDVLRLLNGSESAMHDKKHSGKKKRCLCDECSISRLTTSLLTPELYEEIGLKQLAEGSPMQLSVLDNYLQGINPPDLSSTSSSECSSQEDSEDIPIFSRNDLVPSSYSSPNSDDSDDSDDLDSESSPSPVQDPEDKAYLLSQNALQAAANQLQRLGSMNNVSSGSPVDLVSKEESVQTKLCECHACTTSAAAASKALLSQAVTAKAVEGFKSAAPYLVYQNMMNQPVDLSRHGVTAKHPIIHPHLYNLGSHKQQTRTPPTSTSQAFHYDIEQQEQRRQLFRGDWNNAYESAKKTLSSRCASSDSDPDLLQSVKAALNSRGVASNDLTTSPYDMHSSLHMHTSTANTITVVDKKHHSGHTFSDSCLGNGKTDHDAAREVEGDGHANVHNSPKHTSSSLPAPATEFCAKHMPAAKKASQQPSCATPSASQHQCSSANQLPSKLTADMLRLAMTKGQGRGKEGAKGDHRSTRECFDGFDMSGCFHHGNASPGLIDPQTGLCTTALQTSTSTPTSTSICSDPECETHLPFEAEDTDDSCSEKSSSTVNSNQARESKHCDCCYCEFFGHGNENEFYLKSVSEMRDRLRLRLKERKPKEHMDSYDEPSEKSSSGEFSRIQDVDELVKFIKGDKGNKENQKQDGKENQKQSSKAAKRQRQKQRKAEEKAKLEERARQQRENLEKERLQQERRAQHERAAKERLKKEEQQNRKKNRKQSEQQQQKEMQSKTQRVLAESNIATSSSPNKQEEVSLSKQQLQKKETSNAQGVGSASPSRSDHDKNGVTSTNKMQAAEKITQSNNSSKTKAKKAETDYTKLNGITQNKQTSEKNGVKKMSAQSLNGELTNGEKNKKNKEALKDCESTSRLSTPTKEKKKKKKRSQETNTSIDEIFMPKEDVDFAEMDESEREIEDFKRFCMASTPLQHKEKVSFNVKDLNIKKGAVQAH